MTTARGTRRGTTGGSRRGFSLPEMMIALVMLGVIGTASVRMFTSQTRLYDTQIKQRNARAVARSAVNLMLSELRMVETTGGVEAATASSVTLRVPYVMGMVCGEVLGVTVVSVLPADSTVTANAEISGYAWRSPTGAYTYVNGPVATFETSLATPVCAGNNIGTIPGGGRVLVLAGALPAGAAAGDAVFLYQRIRYDFGTSSLVPGRRGLFRTVMETSVTEELAAPFDATARFRFFQQNRDTSDITVPPVGDIQGLELVFNAASVGTRAGGSTPEVAPYRTSVFFNNRIN